MRAKLIQALVLAGISSAAILAAGPEASAQPRMRPNPLPGGMPVANPAPPPPPPADAQGGGANTAAGATPTKAPPTGPGGKAVGDTSGLSQFESGIEYAPRSGNERVAFSLEDADLRSARACHRSADGQALHLRRQGPQHQGHRLLAAEGDRGRGVPGVSVDPRGERFDRRAPRPLLQDRRFARREDGGARLRGRSRRADRGPLHHAHTPAAQRERRRGCQRPRALQVEGRGHHHVRAGQPAHHHGHRDEHPAHDAHPGGRRRRWRGRPDSGSSLSTTEWRRTSRSDSTRSST